MGFFSELDMELRNRKVARPFDTPVYAKHIIEYYRKARENEQNKK